MRTINAVEREIIALLARQAGRDGEDLARELRAAADDLPVDPDELVMILPQLERHYAIVLPIDRLVRSRLDYVGDLARLIESRVADAQLAGP